MGCSVWVDSHGVHRLLRLCRSGGSGRVLGGDPALAGVLVGSHLDGGAEGPVVSGVDEGSVRLELLRPVVLGSGGQGEAAPAERRGEHVVEQCADSVRGRG